MKRRRWRRSMKAKPEKIWTNSILHMSGWLLHAVGARLSKKNHKIQHRHARGAFVL